MFSIDAKTKLYCIFGNPVAHSLSPAIHNAAFQKRKINAVYLAFRTEEIDKAVNAMRTLNICGASVTIPHKNEVIKYIDSVDKLAADIGSVNTLKNEGGRITGFNTDGYGALLSLNKNNLKIGGRKILVLGNGGSARSISFTLLAEGGDITIAGRNMNRIISLVRDLEKNNPSVGRILINDITSEFMENIDIIINTTSVGMYPETGSMPVNESIILKKHIVFDIVYSPSKTKLLDSAEKKGCKIIMGHEMLLYQGVRQFEIWTGTDAPIDIMRKTLKEKLS